MKTAHFPRICLARRAALALSLTTLPALSFAQGLPQLENPSRGTGGGIMETIRNYGYDIVLLVALLVAIARLGRPQTGHRPTHAAVGARLCFARIFHAVLVFSAS